MAGAEENKTGDQGQTTHIETQVNTGGIQHDIYLITSNEK